MLKTNRLAMMMAGALLLAALAGTTLTAGETEQTNTEKAGISNGLRIEVSVNGFSFVSQGPTDENGFPLAGSTIFVKGYIYPAGTLNGEDGINPDGSPQYPDLVIGTWINKGYFIKAFTEASGGGPVISSTETFFFDSAEYGSQIIVTEGYIIEGNEPNHRAVVGSTGGIIGKKDQVVETRMGANLTGFPNYTEQFTIKIPDLFKQNTER